MTRKIIPYNPKLKDLARKHRSDSTKSEIKLWMELKGKQVYGYDFHRQKPLLNYIVDFYCSELELVIELDGYSHQFEEVIIKDELKETELKNYGLTILRFDDAEVMNDMANVLRTIEQYIFEYEKEELDDYPLQHTPNPSQEGKATHEAFISSKKTYPLRLEVLWQHKNSLNECGLEIDDLESTFHVGAYKNEELVSIGTFLLQNNEKFKELKQYRLRAMATSPKVRGENFGKKIIEFAINELQNRKVELLWCDAREVALGFYEKMGFITVGDFYNVPQIGPHKLMYKKI